MTQLKKNKKGFTLVEIIVVLVILAILAAIMIPTMIGFVNDAQGKAEISNARAAYLACQMVVTEESRGTPTLTSGTPYTIGDASGNARLNTLLESDFTGAKVTATINNSRVTEVVYISTDGKYKVTITPGESSVVEPNSAT